MKRELKDQVAELEPWRQVAMLAGSVERVVPVFALFASPEERHDHRAVAEELWRLAREGTEFTLTGAAAPFSRIWPYPDEEDEEEEDDSFELYTPVYWKLEVLQGINMALWHARNGSLSRASVTGVGYALDIIDGISQDVRGRLPRGTVPDHPDSAVPFIDNETDTIRACLRLLRESPTRAEAVAAIRALSQRQADLLATALLPRWVEAKGWDAQDLRAANGVRRA